jgi:hypothetical protein
MSLLQAVGLTLLPNIGGLAGLVITKKHLKDGWYGVSIENIYSFLNTNLKFVINYSIRN